jgi:hypothetical protein
MHHLYRGIDSVREDEIHKEPTLQAQNDLNSVHKMRRGKNYLELSNNM